MNAERSAGIVPELAWFKSSYSTGSGGECVEVAMAWRKSRRSAGDGGECVEVAACPQAIHVRDSKDTARPGLMLAASAWTALVGFATRQTGPKRSRVCFGRVGVRGRPLF
ncbi:DUF397 domain-containing protein [Streptomyces goshikiensis]|uniref:DUF397 domain-containing protein n=1 Tax=Streptomyces goshikiensis TaxID=1942 RepID=UPI0036BDBA73